MNLQVEQMISLQLVEKLNLHMISLKMVESEDINLVIGGSSSIVVDTA